MYQFAEGYFQSSLICRHGQSADISRYVYANSGIKRSEYANSGTNMALIHKYKDQAVNGAKFRTG